MGVLFTPKRWNVAPPLGVQVQWGHPLAQALKYAFLLNEAGGACVQSAAGGAIVGPLTATAANWSQSLVGPCLDNGAGVAVTVFTVAANPLVNITGRISVEAWVYPTISNAYQGVVLSSNAGGTRDYGFFLSASGTSAIYLVLDGNQGDSTVSPGWATNRWNHIVLTADGTSSRFYINGVLANTRAISSLPLGRVQPVYVGGETGNSFPLNGKIAKACAWNRALTQSEIQQLYQDPYCFMQPQSPLIRYWSTGAAPSGPAVAVLMDSYRRRRI